MTFKEKRVTTLTEVFMRWLVSLTMFLVSIPLYGQTKFPSGPLMTPLPGASIVVTTKQICVIEGAVDFILKVSPASGITITKDSGPLTYKGEFPDSPGKTQKRTFKGPFLYQIEGVGDVEIFSIPLGFKDEKEITSQLYSFVPEVPPDVVPDPIDKPKPKPSGTKTFWLVLVEETADRTAPTLINDKAYWDSKAPHSWMSYDQSTPKGQKYKTACDKAGVKLPAMLLIEQKAVPPITASGIFALTTKADADAAIKSSGGK